MSLVDRTGNFRAEVIDSGVGQTGKSELPQLVLSLALKEMHDGDDWVDWSEYDQTITAYLVLVSKEGKDLLNSDQVKKVFGWDGRSFAELDSMELTGKMCMVRVEENTYNEKTSMQVNWIDLPDAEPGHQMKKLDPAALKSLDAKFGRKAKVTPKSSTPKSKSKAAVPPKTPPKSKKVAPKVEGCTKDEAWDFINQDELWVDDMTPAKVIGMWSEAIEEMGDDEDKFTDGDWFIIREKIVKNIFKF